MKQLNWYQIFGQTHTIPDGRTVEPTDDIQIWLHCANIWDKTYTTLAEVLADTDTLSALINSENAVDYMVRSTTWAASITVPKMTSNTTPSGTCYADSVQSGSQIYYAFDGNDSTSWNSGRGPVGDYVGYIFTSATCINFVKIKSHANDVLKKYKVQGSNDGVEYTDVSPEITHVSNELKSFANSNSYLYYRAISTEKTATDRLMLISVQFYSASITGSESAMTYIGQNNYCANTLLADATWCEAICNSEYFESVLNTKVPIMTSATTPSGEAFASSFYVASCEGWRAFNGNTSYAWVSSSADSTPYVGYMFTTTPHVHKVTMTVKYRTYSYANNLSAVAQYYDGENWNDIETLSLPSESTNIEVVKNLSYTLSNTSEGSGFRLKFNHSTRPAGTNYFSCDILQFYGREDV